MDKPWVYIVLIGVLCLVLARLNPKGAAKKEESTPVREMEDTLEHFAAELEEENNQLLEAVAKMKKENENHINRMVSRVELLEKQNYDLSQEMKQLLVNEAQRQKAEVVSQTKEPEPATVRREEPPIARAEKPAMPAVEPDTATASSMNIQERYGELFELHRQGKSVDQIAKKLGMNKGEIMLIIQLAEREAQIGVQK